MKKFLLIISLCLMQLASAQSLLSKMYCRFLGNTDVKEEYKQLTYEALTTLGVKNPENIAVKKMNSVGSLFAGMPVSSFTAFGIWLDEESLDVSSLEERTFQIYHEAAHYAQQHHQRLLFLSAGLVAAEIGSLKCLNGMLQEKSAYPLACTMAVAALATTAIYLGLLPNVVKHQEKEADIVAAKQLILSDKRSIVDAHIKKLQQSDTPQNSHLWWFSMKDQECYLENLRSGIVQ